MRIARIGEEKPTRAEDMVSLCSLHAGGRPFCVDTREVREVLGACVAQPVPLAPPYIAGVMAYRGNVLTTVSLRTLLGLESAARAGCVLVLEDEEAGRQFGLAADWAGGMVTVAQRELEANPSTLDERSAAIFDGVYKMQEGLMVRLDARRLRPLQLARSGLFGNAEHQRGWERCEH